jgi:integrase/recombinase XerC
MKTLLELSTQAITHTPCVFFYPDTQKGVDISTLEKDFINWLETTPNTIETYKKSIRVFFAYIREKGITNPTREDLKDFRNYLLTTRKATTTASYINALKQFYRFLDYKEITTDITKHLKGAKVSTRIHRKEPLTLEHARDILSSSPRESVEDKRNYAILLLLLTSGMRTIEIIRANKDDIVYQCGSMALNIWGKGRQEKDRYTKLPYSVEKAINDYLNARGETSKDAPLFASVSDRNNGGRLTTRSVSRIVKASYLRIGLDNPLFTAHSTRHFVASQLIKSGKPIEEVAEQLGHTNTNTTKIYIHALDRASLNNEETLSNLLLKEAN